MKNNINKKMGVTLLAAAIMAGTAVIPMSNAAVEAAATKAAKATNKPSIEYIAHIQDWGWSKGWVSEGQMAGTEGEARRVEALKIRMTNCEGVSLKFKAHIQDYGDMEFTDASEIIGTVGEAKRVEAITITSTGLKEKGYKLQYRVHIENLGWSQGWVDEGEMAGTMGQSLRLEAVEIRVVPIAEGTKAEYMLTLSNYDVVLAEKMGEDTDEYKEMEKTIATAIANINKAETDEDAKVIYDATVIEVKSIRPRIDAEVEAVLKEKATVKADADEVLAEYTETASTIIGLDSGSAANLALRIATAKSQVENAKSPAKITAIMNNLEEVMNLPQYKLAIAKTKAVNELSKYLTADASTGVKSKVEKAVKDAKKGTVPATITANATSVKNDLDALITAQKYAEEQLNIYANSMSTLSEEEKAFVSEKITKVRKVVDEAEDADVVTDAMRDFKNDIDTRFPTVADDAADELNAADEANTLKQTVDLSVANLRAYANTVKFWSNKKAGITKPTGDNITENVKGTEKAQELAKEYIEEYIADINAAKSVEEINTIMNGKAAEGTTPAVKSAEDELDEKIAGVINYDVAYDVAIARVKRFAELANLPSEVKEYIENTRIGLKEVNTEAEVEEIMESFNAYMIDLDLEDKLTDSATEQAKIDALRELQKYTTSEIGETATIAKEAIKSINNATTYAPTTYTDAMADIVWQYKLDAYTKLVIYTTEPEYADIDSKDKNEDGTFVKLPAKAQEYIDDITAVSVVGDDYATAISTVTSKLNKAKTEIGKLTVLAEDKANAEFIEERDNKVAEITAMRDLAKDVGASEAYDIANSYIALVSATANQAKLDQRVGEYNTDIDEVVKASATGKNLAVYRINVVLEAIEDFDATEKSQINAVINRVKVAIKNMKKDDAEANESALVENELAKITTVQNAVTNVNGAKVSAISDLTPAEGDTVTPAEQLKIDKAINDIKAIYVDAKKANDETDPYGESEAIAKITIIKKEATSATALEFTVTFKNDTTTVSTATANKASNYKVTLPTTNPSKAGYTFAGWEVNGVPFTANTTVADDVTVTAKWTEIVYTVTFNDGTDTITATANNANSYKVTLPSNPSKTGYTFDGWEADGVPFTADTVVTKNMTVTAKWAPSYTVTFKKDKEDTEVVDTKVATKADAYKVTTLPSNPSKDGYTFVKWVIVGADGNPTATEFTATTLVEANTVVVAIWTPVQG